MTEPIGTVTNPNQDVPPVPSETVQQMLHEAFEGVPTDLLENYVDAHEEAISVGHGRTVSFSFTADQNPDSDYNSFSYSDPPGARRDGANHRGAGGVPARLFPGMIRTLQSRLEQHRAQLVGTYDKLCQVRAQLDRIEEKYKDDNNNSNASGMRRKYQAELARYVEKVEKALPRLAGTLDHLDGEAIIQRALTEIDALEDALEDAVAATLRITDEVQSPVPAEKNSIHEVLQQVSNRLGVALEDMYRHAADSNVSKVDLPTMAGAMYASGRVYSATSEKEFDTGQLHPFIIMLLNQIPNDDLKSVGHGSCSEMRGLSDYIYAWVAENRQRYQDLGLDLNDGEVLHDELLKHFERAGAATIAHYMHDKEGVYGVPACQSCRSVLARLGIVWVYADEILTTTELGQATSRLGPDASKEQVEDAVEEAERKKMRDNLRNLRWWRGPGDDDVEGGEPT